MCLIADQKRGAAGIGHAEQERTQAGTGIGRHPRERVRQVRRVGCGRGRGRHGCGREVGMGKTGGADSSECGAQDRRFAGTDLTVENGDLALDDGVAEGGDGLGLGGRHQ